MAKQNLIVQKYGGTSLDDPKRIKSIARHIKKLREKGHQIIAVVSAMGQETDRIITNIKAISKKPSPRELDQALHAGEIISAALLATALNDIGVKAKSYTANQLGLVTTDDHGAAKIKSVKSHRLLLKEANDHVIVAAGFQGLSERNSDITTLGRGGSDATAVALAAAVGANACEIYTDVDGVYAIDPHLVKNARCFVKISYEQMLSMAVAGAGVLMDRAVEIARAHGVVIKILLSPSLGKSKGGTTVSTLGTIHNIEKNVCTTAAAIKTDVGVLEITEISNRPGEAGKIFAALKNVNVIDVAQTPGDNKAAISILLESDAINPSLAVLKKLNCRIKTSRELAIVALVDPLMKETPGYLARITKALGAVKVNIELITTSQISISVAIKESDIKKAANALAREFALIKK